MDINPSMDLLKLFGIYGICMGFTIDLPLIATTN
jgi:hypothetical protein